MPRFLLTLSTLLMILGSWQGFTPAMAADSDPTKPDAREILTPWVYGDDNAPLKITMQIAPGAANDNAFFLKLYPLVAQKVGAGQTQFSLSILANTPVAMPVFLTASCVNHNAAPNFIYSFFQNEKGILYGTTDVETAVMNLALSDPSYYPAGLTTAQFSARIKWCQSFRREAIIDSETRRFNNTYNWSLDFGNGPMPRPVIVINKKSHEGMAELPLAIKALQ